MIDRVSLTILAVIAAAILGDFLLNDARATMFLLLKLADLVEYVSVWR